MHGRRTRRARSTAALVLGVALAAGAAVIAGARLGARRRRERLVDAMRPLGHDGVRLGAEPLDLAGDARRAVLVLHGFGDTPQSVAGLCRHLHSSGWTVRAPLLPGHGRRLGEFARTDGAAWLGAVRAEYERMRGTYATVALVGLSMGGALAAVLAAEVPPPALVLISPYVSVPTRVRWIAHAHHMVGLATPYLYGRGGRSIQNPQASRENLAYGWMTPRLVRELVRVVDQARAALPRITAPTLVVQAREDSRIPADAAERAFALLRAPAREMVWLDGCGHVLTVDYRYDEVFSLAAAWLDRYTAA